MLCFFFKDTSKDKKATEDIESNEGSKGNSQASNQSSSNQNALDTTLVFPDDSSIDSTILEGESNINTSRTDDDAIFTLEGGDSSVMSDLTENIGTPFKIKDGEQSKLSASLYDEITVHSSDEQINSSLSSFDEVTVYSNDEQSNVSESSYAEVTVYSQGDSDIESQASDSSYYDFDAFKWKRNENSFHDSPEEEVREMKAAMKRAENEAKYAEIDKAYNSESGVEQAEIDNKQPLGTTRPDKPMLGEATPMPTAKTAGGKTTNANVSVKAFENVSFVEAEDARRGNAALNKGIGK